MTIEEAKAYIIREYWDVFGGQTLKIATHWDGYTEKDVTRPLSLPSAQPETCEGCKHLGKWENELEYGYPSPCTRCKRRVNDHYER